MRKLLLALFLLSSAANLFAQETLMPRGDFWDKPGYFFVRLGFISTGNFVLDGREEDTQAGFSFGAGMEWQVAHRWHWGVGVDVHRAHLSDSGQYFIDISTSIKWMYFDRSAKIGLRPGFALGLGLMDYFTTFGDVRVERSAFVTWKSSVETIFFGRSRVAPYVEFGLFGSLDGVSGAHDLRFGPSAFIRGGVLF